MVRYCWRYIMKCIEVYFFKSGNYEYRVKKRVKVEWNVYYLIIYFWKGVLFNDYLWNSVW